MKVTLQKLLSIAVEEELKILVSVNMSGDKKLDENMSTKILTGSYVLYFSRLTLKSPRRKIFFEFFLLSFSKNDYIISFVNLLICRDGCLEISPTMKFDDAEHTVSIKIDSNLPGM